MDLAKTVELTLLSRRLSAAAVERACDEARALHLAALVAHPAALPRVAEHLRGSDVRVGTVAGLKGRGDARESMAVSAARAVEAGAEEIEIPMDMEAMASGRFLEARDDLASAVRAARVAARDLARGDVIVRAMIEASQLDHKVVRLACKIAVDCGADLAGCATHAPRVEDVALMREALPAEVGVGVRGVRTVAEVTDMIEAGAARVGSDAAALILGVPSGSAPAAGSGTRR